MDGVDPAQNTLPEGHREGPQKYSVLDSATLVEGKREEGLRATTTTCRSVHGIICLSLQPFYLVQKADCTFTPGQNPEDFYKETKKVVWEI